MNGLAAACAVLLAFAAAWEAAGEHGEFARRMARRASARLSAGRVQSVAQAVLALGLARRLERAGMADRFAPPAVLGAKVAGVAAGVGCAMLAVPAVPGRLGLVATPVLVAAGFLAPDALLERAARRRHAQLVASLPDALDVLAVGAAAGRPPARVMRELAAAGAGPLAGELAVAVADLDTGSGQERALCRLRERVDGDEVAALTAALERSRRYGSPLAEQLQAQAAALRSEARRRTEETAARAAPKIQLVVALILVPSVLLMIGAAILAHSDELLGSL